MFESFQFKGLGLWSSKLGHSDFGWLSPKHRWHICSLTSTFSCQPPCGLWFNEMRPGQEESFGTKNLAFFMYVFSMSRCARGPTVVVTSERWLREACSCCCTALGTLEAYMYEYDQSTCGEQSYRLKHARRILLYRANRNPWQKLHALVPALPVQSAQQAWSFSSCSHMNGSSCGVQSFGCSELSK